MKFFSEKSSIFERKYNFHSFELILKFTKPTTYDILEGFLTEKVSFLLQMAGIT